MNEQKKQKGGIWQPPVQTPQENFQERQRLTVEAHKMSQDAELAARSTPKIGIKPAADNAAKKGRTASRKKSAERSKARKELTAAEALRIYHEGTDEHTEMARALFGPDVVVRTAGGSIKAK